MSLPTHLRTRQSHCWYTDNVHLYVFVRSKQGTKTESGVTVKRRRKDGIWRHYTVRAMIRREESTIFHSEVVTHLSKDWGRGRIARSKRYIRFKFCI